MQESCEREFLINVRARICFKIQNLRKFLAKFFRPVGRRRTFRVEYVISLGAQRGDSKYLDVKLHLPKFVISLNI